MKKTPQQILDIVCEHLDTNPNYILKTPKKRNRELVLTRQLTMYAINAIYRPEFDELTPDEYEALTPWYKNEYKLKMYNVTKEKKTLTFVGKLFGKHHATVIHAIRAINDIRTTDKHFRAHTDILFKKFGIDK